MSSTTPDEQRDTLIALLRTSRPTAAWFREGYDQGEVDRALEAIATDLASNHPRYGAESTDLARFTPVRFRAGYSMNEVDALLDQVTAHLTRAGRLTGDQLPRG